MGFAMDHLCSSGNVAYPGEKRGEVSVELRGDLAAFLYLAEPAREGIAWVGSPDGTLTSRMAVAQVGNGGSGVMMGSLVAGAGNHRQLTPIVVAC